MSVSGQRPKAPGQKLGHSHGKRDGDTVFKDENLSGRPAHKVAVPEADPEWHPYAIGWLNALKLSPLADDFRETDWMQAMVGAALLDEGLTVGWKAYTLHEWNQITERLCCTLGDRRRARIELIRAGVDDDEQGAVADIEDWQAKLGA